MRRRAWDFSPKAFTFAPKTDTASGLVVQSRGRVDGIEAEAFGLFHPGFADGFVGGEAAQGLEPLGEVVGVQEGGEVTRSAFELSLQWRTVNQRR